MIPLDDTDRARYRADLLQRVVQERYPEEYRTPTALDDSPVKIAERVRILERAMTDENGRAVRLRRRQRAA